MLRSNFTQETARQLLDAGADDVLGEHLDAFDIASRLRSAQRIIELQEQLLAAREALRFETTHDGATGVFNRSGLNQHIHREFERAARFGHSLGAILIDLDYFRIINESFGYHAGDKVLREVAARLKGALRAYDILGRYGADEFLIIAPETPSVPLAAMAERILTTVTATPVQFDGQQILVTAAIGVADNEGRTQNELILAAESAMKEAKHRGRNCIEHARTIHLHEESEIFPPRPYLVH
jgi:diguanylate cyclase (GGDEF)-like protein